MRLPCLIRPGFTADVRRRPPDAGRSPSWICWNARTRPRLAAAPPQCRVVRMRHGCSVSADRVDDGDVHANLLLARLDGHGRRRRAESGTLREDRVGNRALIRDADHGTEMMAE